MDSSGSLGNFLSSLFGFLSELLNSIFGALANIFSGINININ